MVRRIVWALIVLSVNASLLSACRGDQSMNSSRNPKGAGFAMKTYQMGRFALDVPLDMKQAVQAQTIRGCEIEEILLPTSSSMEQTMSDLWAARLVEIGRLKCPEKIKKVVIETKDLKLGSNMAKAVFYYGSYISSRKGTWDLFFNASNTAVWIRYSGLIAAKDKMLDWAVNTAKAYSNYIPEKSMPSSGLFFLKYGALDLQFFAQEKTYARFEGPQELKLEVEMNETHQVENLGMAERLAAALATRYAPGVDVDKIRSRSRTAAGLKGEELVMRMSARGEDTQLNFSWEFRGEVDSGERPEILITMETPDENLDAKLKVWDRILDSFKPMYR